MGSEAIAWPPSEDCSVASLLAMPTLFTSQVFCTLPCNLSPDTVSHKMKDDRQPRMEEKTFPNEHELIIQAQQGDSDAFKKLFDTYGTKVYNFVLRMLGKPHDAEDVVQEVFVKMYQKLPSLRETRYFSTWLFSIAKNESINFLNRHRRKNIDSIHDESENLANDLTVADNSESATPQGQAEYSDLQIQLQAALNEIPEINRSAFILGVIEGYSYKEVGKILGCSVTNVKSRVFRARALLSEKLGAYLQK